MDAEQAAQTGKGLLKAVAIGAILFILGAIALQGFSGTDSDVQAGGLQTTDRSCEFVKLALQSLIQLSGLTISALPSLGPVVVPDCDSEAPTVYATTV